MNSIIDTNIWVNLDYSLSGNVRLKATNNDSGIKYMESVSTDKLHRALEELIMQDKIFITKNILKEITNVIDKTQPIFIFLNEMIDKKPSFCVDFNPNNALYMKEIKARATPTDRLISNIDIEICLHAKVNKLRVITDEKYNMSGSKFKKIPNFCEYHQISWGDSYSFFVFILNNS